VLFELKPHSVSFLIFLKELLDLNIRNSSELEPLIVNGGGVTPVFLESAFSDDSVELFQKC
jgi:hypothetical protein